MTAVTILSGCLEIEPQQNQPSERSEDYVEFRNWDVKQNERRSIQYGYFLDEFDYAVIFINQSNDPDYFVTSRASDRGNRAFLVSKEGTEESLNHSKFVIEYQGSELKRQRFDFTRREFEDFFKQDSVEFSLKCIADYHRKLREPNSRSNL